ncbi:MAG: alpha/beta hydrolase [Bacteroidota bacterium]
MGLLPKGNLLQELAYMPTYWWKMRQARPPKTPAQRYDFGSHHMQYLLYFPPLENMPRKEQAIIYFHGGGWCFGVPSMFASNAYFFQRQGYGVFMPCYRRVPTYNVTHIREDLSLGLGKIMELKDVLNLEVSSFLLGGMSAGGNLAALLAFDQALWQHTTFTKAQLAGLFLCGAPLDLAKMQWSILLHWYAGPKHQPLFQTASPINYLHESANFPILCLHGTSDGMVRFASANSFLEACTAKTQCTIQLETIHNGTHLDAGSWPYQDQPAGQVLRAWLRTINPSS